VAHEPGGLSDPVLLDQLLELTLEYPAAEDPELPFGMLRLHQRPGRDQAVEALGTSQASCRDDDAARVLRARSLDQRYAVRNANEVHRAAEMLAAGPLVAFSQRRVRVQPRVELRKGFLE
jgi:hypothetical protein